MKHSKVAVLLVLLLVLLMSIVSCAKASEPAPATAPETGAYKDGVYKAEMEEFSETGWKDFVEVTVEGGKITAVNWDAINKDDANLFKKQASKDGTYDMKKAGAQAAWHEQAALVEAKLVELGDPALITYSDDEGHSDAITGVSIHVKEFFELAAKALEGAK